jgi:hypothetical protein
MSTIICASSPVGLRKVFPKATCKCGASRSMIPLTQGARPVDYPEACDVLRSCFSGFSVVSGTGYHTGQRTREQDGDKHITADSHMLIYKMAR